MRSFGTRIAICVVALAALTAAGQMTAPRALAEQAAAGEPSAAEISQRIALRSAIPGKSYSRADVIEELREEKRKIHEARQAGVEILDAEVDAEYARMARRMKITTTQMTGNLAQEGVTPDTIKHRLRADLAWQRYQQERRQAQ
jgi:peptidyl-prolyl cis-trans isomerase SurA